jgi:hypothetical protein
MQNGDVLQTVGGLLSFQIGEFQKDGVGRIVLRGRMLGKRAARIALVAIVQRNFFMFASLMENTELSRGPLFGYFRCQ